MGLKIMTILIGIAKASSWVQLRLLDLLQKYFSDSVLDAVAHGGDPQDRAASLYVNSCPLFPDPLFPVPYFCKKSIE